MNKFCDELIELNPELKSYYSSEQYALSEDIISFMVNRGLDSGEMADLLKLDKDYYLRLESGDDSINISEYQKVIELLDKEI